MTTTDPNRAVGSVTLKVEIVRDMLSIKSTRWRIRLAKISAYGRSISDAKADFTRKLYEGIERMDTDPAFARDDDGSLIVAVQQSQGVVHYRVDGDHVRPITGCDGPPRESLASVWHYRVLGDGS